VFQLILAVSSARAADGGKSIAFNLLFVWSKKTKWEMCGAGGAVAGNGANPWVVVLVDLNCMNRRGRAWSFQTIAALAFFARTTASAALVFIKRLQDVLADGVDAVVKCLCEFVNAC